MVDAGFWVVCSRLGATVMRPGIDKDVANADRKIPEKEFSHDCCVNQKFFQKSSISLCHAFEGTCRQGIATAAPCLMFDSVFDKECVLKPVLLSYCIHEGASK